LRRELEVVSLLRKGKLSKKAEEWESSEQSQMPGAQSHFCQIH